MSDKMFFIIKMKQEASVLNNFREYLINSKKESSPPAYYYLTTTTTTTDYEMFEKMQFDKKYRCALLDYAGTDITHLYWAECTRHEKNNTKSIHCKLLFETSDKPLIDNFIYSLELDLDKDFTTESYINYEISELLFNQMSKYEKKPIKSLDIV